MYLGTISRAFASSIAYFYCFYALDPLDLFGFYGSLGYFHYLGYITSTSPTRIHHVISVLPIIITFCEADADSLCLWSGPLIFHEEDLYLWCYAMRILITFRGRSLLSCSVRQMLIMCRGISLFSMLREADAYLSRPCNGFLYSLILHDTDLYDLHLFKKRDLHLLCFARQISCTMFHEVDPIFHAPRRIPTSMLHKVDAYLLRPEATDYFLWSVGVCLLLILLEADLLLFCKAGSYLSCPARWTLRSYVCKMDPYLLSSMRRMPVSYKHKVDP